MSEVTQETSVKMKLGRIFADKHAKDYKPRYVRTTDRPPLTESMTLPTIPTLLIV